MFGKGFILREENDMIIKSVNLETVCGITSKLPDNTLPEVAFAGKSNVGKSSLINALMNRKSYARISAQPGKTQTINYYNINEELYYVDLPGYGLVGDFQLGPNFDAAFFNSVCNISQDL